MRINKVCSLESGLPANLNFKYSENNFRASALIAGKLQVAGVPYYILAGLTGFGIIFKLNLFSLFL
jgi:hypothetical protein